MSNSLPHHGLRHARLSCPLLSTEICSNSRPLCWWCYPTISSPFAPFSSCLQSFPASGSFPMSWLFTSVGQNIGASISASVPSMNIQGWSCSPRDSQESSPTPQFKSINSLVVSSVQFSSIAQSCPTLCDPMNRSTPGLPVHHQLPEFIQTCVHRVSDALQPSHPLSSRFSPAPNPSQHQSLFQWVNSLHEVAKVLEFQI